MTTADAKLWQCSLFAFLALVFWMIEASAVGCKAPQPLRLRADSTFQTHFAALAWTPLCIAGVWAALYWRP